MTRIPNKRRNMFQEKTKIIRSNSELKQVPCLRLLHTRPGQQGPGLASSRAPTRPAAGPSLHSCTQGPGSRAKPSLLSSIRIACMHSLPHGWSLNICLKYTSKVQIPHQPLIPGSLLLLCINREDPHYPGYSKAINKYLFRLNCMKMP